MSWQQVYAAVRDSDLEQLKNLGDAVLLTRSAKGKTALYVAVEEDKPAVFNFVIEHYPALVDIVDNDFHSVLDLAMYWNRNEMLSKIISMRPGLATTQRNVFDKNVTPLQHAVKFGKMFAVQTMLEHDPNAITYICKLNNKTLLHDAVESCDLTMVRFILFMMPKSMFDAQNQANNTLLHDAVQKNSLRLVQLVYESFPHLLDRNEWGETPFLAAVVNGFYEIVDFFLKVDPTVIAHCCIDTGRNALALATHYDIIERLLRVGPNLIDGWDKDGNTPLHVALSCCNDVCLSLLIAAKPSLLNAKNTKGQTPLCLAFEECKYNAVAVLLQHATCEQDCDNDGNTTLHMSVRCGDLSVLTQVLESHPDAVNCENKKGLTPFEIALCECNSKAARALLPKTTTETVVKTKKQRIMYKSFASYIESEFITLQQFILPELSKIVMQYLDF